MQTRAIKDLEVYRLIARLRIQTNMDEDKVLQIFEAFEESIKTEAQLVEVGTHAERRGEEGGRTR